MSSAGDILLQVPLLGLDSFVAGVLLGPVVKTWRVRAGLASLFGLCDGVAVALGACFEHALPDLPGVLVYALAAGSIVLAGRRSGKWRLLAPLILSLDNLASGAAADAAPAFAVSSAAMALAGMALTAVLVRAGVALRCRGREVRRTGNAP